MSLRPLTQGSWDGVSKRLGKHEAFTQQEVADSVAVARTTITALEKGERRPRPDELMQMARLYGRSVGDFVGPREPTADFTVQFRMAVSGAASLDAQEELRQAIQEFQGLCEDYLYLENLAGASLWRNYPLSTP